MGLEGLLWVFWRMHSATLMFAFPSLPEPAPSPSSHLSWHLLVSLLHILLTMAQTHRKEGDVRCPFLDSHVQTNKVINVTAST